MNIISWNIKSFVSCVNNNTNALIVLKTILTNFDMAVIYEVPNTVGGNTALTMLMNSLPAPSSYLSFSEASGGIGNEDDQVAVIWNRLTVSVANTTGTRRPANFGGRAPVYFNVTELASGNTRECCAWHAPAPGGPASALISQGWQNILQNSVDRNHNPLTSIVMGDFNSDFVDPSAGKRRRTGGFLSKLILTGATTLIPPSSPPANNPPTSSRDYRTQNRYDQFYAQIGVVTVQGSGIYDVMDKLVNNAAPFMNLFGNQYNTPQRAYAFYYPNLSDHLPVAMTVTL